MQCSMEVAKAGLQEQVLPIDWAGRPEKDPKFPEVATDPHSAGTSARTKGTS